jgi:hypothetical protein
MAKTIAENLQNIIDVKKKIQKDRYIEYGVPFSEYPERLNDILYVNPVQPLTITKQNACILNWYKKVIVESVDISESDWNYYNDDFYIIDENDGISDSELADYYDRNIISASIKNLLNERIKTHGGIYTFIQYATDDLSPLLFDNNIYDFVLNLIDFTNIDISKLTNFGSMFDGCSSLTSVPELNTQNGTNFGCMFSGCSSLTSVPELNTQNGTNFSYMFSGCSSLTSVPELNTQNGTNFSYMFSGCSSLTSVPELNTQNGTNFSNMFSGCSSLTSVPELNTQNGTNFSHMFSGCSSLTSVPELNTQNGTNFSYMFSGCSSLTSVPELNTQNGTNLDDIFHWCSNLTYIPALDASNVRYVTTVYDPCYGCGIEKTDENVLKSQTSIYFGGFKGLKDHNLRISTNYSLKTTNTWTQVACPLFTSESITDIFNNLGTNDASNIKRIIVSQKQPITDEQKAIATNKGWTIEII